MPPAMPSSPPLLQGMQTAIDFRQEVHDANNSDIDAVNAATAWGSPLVSNWYKNSDGRITANLPFRIIDYRRMTTQPDPADQVFS